MKRLVALLVPVLAGVLPVSAQVSIALVAPAATSVAAVQPIREAKKQPFGTVISVAGRITASSEFGGPAYLQDATGGIAVFDAGLHAGASTGDSVEVTGPYTEFGAGAEPGSGLGQISGQGVSWQVVEVEPVAPAPRTITLAEIDESVEGELVRITGVTITGSTGAPRSFQQNKNYTIADATGTAQLRIDNNTNLVGAAIPEEAIALTGVVGQYMGTHQILPRRTDDLGIDVRPNPWDTLSKEETFDIATWNVEWFGDQQNGPEDDTLQLRNVLRTIDSIDADLYGLQEVVDANLFRALLDSLPRYGGLYSYGIGQPQKMAYLFKRSVIDSVTSAHVLKTPGTWGNGRYPLLFTFDATVGGVKKRIYAFQIHGKATGDQPADDYAQRTEDATALYDFLNAVYRDNHVIVLGDFNDDVDVSTHNGQPSPYRAFVENTARYSVLTKPLSDRGASSYSKGASMLDHILVSDELTPFVLAGSEQVENPYYIGSYLTTTSDHYPVSVRLRFTQPTSVQEQAVPGDDVLTVYPNPVRSGSAALVRVEVPGRVRLEIVDVAGRTIAVVCDEVLSAGQYTLPLPVPAADGVYYCRLHTAGATIVRSIVVTH